MKRSNLEILLSEFLYLDRSVKTGFNNLKLNANKINFKIANWLTDYVVRKKRRQLMIFHLNGDFLSTEIGLPLKNTPVE